MIYLLCLITRMQFCNKKNSGNFLMARLNHQSARFVKRHYLFLTLPIGSVWVIIFTKENDISPIGIWQDTHRRLHLYSSLYTRLLNCYSPQKRWSFRNLWFMVWNVLLSVHNVATVSAVFTRPFTFIVQQDLHFTMWLCVLNHILWTRCPGAPH